MPILVLSWFRFVRLLLSGHVAVAMENAALRVQLVAFQRKRKQPTLTPLDRLFWVGLSLLWTGWRAPLVYVRADTVVRWQRERFRRFWARRSRVNQRHRGRPTTAVEIRRLIEMRRELGPQFSHALGGGPKLYLFTDGHSVHIDEQPERILKWLTHAKNGMSLVCLSDQIVRVTSKKAPHRYSTTQLQLF